MRLTDFLSATSCLPCIPASTKTDVLQAISNHIAAHHTNLSATDVFNTLWEREELGSTGIEFGIAIPHGRLKSLSKPILVFGKTKQPIDFNAIDGMATDIFVTLLAPSGGNDHLLLLSKLARLFHSQAFVEQLRYCRTTDEMFVCIRHWETILAC